MSGGLVAVLGAGVMGTGIAQVAAAAGREVVVCTRTSASLERARRDLDAALTRDHERGRMDEEPAVVLGRVSWRTELTSVAPAAVVIESVPEHLALKRELFTALGELCSPEALLATNTSALPISAIAAAAARPERVVGMHFFSPVPAMALCEVVRGERTSTETVQRAEAFAAGIGKSTIVVDRDVAGFVTTRLMAVLVLEAARLVEAGVASAAEVDLACRLGFGHPMGPLETADLAGVDTLVDVADGLYAHHLNTIFAVPRSVRDLVATGRRGRKSGVGFHEYPNHPRDPA